jgi:hypothetical protein
LAAIRIIVAIGKRSAAKWKAVPFKADNATGDNRDHFFGAKYQKRE